MSKALTVGHYRLLSMPHAQCHVYIKRYEDDSVYAELISYNTSVLFINYTPGVGAFLHCSGTYSVTTARHINRFTREFCGENKYHECKSALSDLDKRFGPGWCMVCEIDSERFLNMCYNYEHEARGYYGRY